jgi:hypothetical protein
MAKRAGHSTQLKDSVKHPNSVDAEERVEQSGTKEHDARGDQNKLAENQQDLGVKPDHKTEEMEKGRRGTFP